MIDREHPRKVPCSLRGCIQVRQIPHDIWELRRDDFRSEITGHLIILLVANGLLLWSETLTAGWKKSRDCSTRCIFRHNRAGVVQGAGSGRNGRGGWHTTACKGSPSRWGIFKTFLLADCRRNWRQKGTRGDEMFLLLLQVDLWPDDRLLNTD